MMPGTVSELQRRAHDAALLLKAMANANRLLILCMLVERQQVSAGVLGQACGLSPSATSQHLARMRSEGLVVAQREGTTMHYAIANPDLERIITTLKDIYCP